MATGNGQGQGPGEPAQAQGQGPDFLAPGTVLGRYEIRRQLGRGGMGAVYEAIHRDLKKRVAVKVLMASLATNEEARARFLREGEAASRIRHPHIVDVTDVGTEGNLSYLVMEFLEGEDLAGRLGRGGILSVQEAADILLPVCAGLGAAHDEGVIHRDLKPENIFLARPRHGGVQPKVLDFGISKVAGSPGAMALTGTAATFGTPFYMPPEQLRGARQADHKSDQYALGVVLYECLTGRRPFEAENIYAMLRAIGDGDYPLPRVVNPQLSEEIELVIVRAMRLDPAQRFDSVRHLGAALLPFASDNGRALWTEAFRGHGDGSAFGGSTGSGMGMTMVLPSDGATTGGGAGTGRGTGGFGEAQPTPPPVPGVVTGRSRSGGSITGGSVSGTRILPSTPPPARSGPTTSRGTTLGSATGQRFGWTEPPPARSRKGLVIGALLVVGGAAAGAVFYLRPFDNKTGTGTAAVTAPSHETAATTVPPRPETFHVDIETEPPGALLELDDRPTGSGSLRREFPKDGQRHRLVGHADGFRDTVVTFIDESPGRKLVLVPLTPEPKTTAAADPTPTPAGKGKGGGGGSKSSRPHHGGGSGGGKAAPAAAATPKPPAPSGGGVPATANGAPVID